MEYEYKGVVDDYFLWLCEKVDAEDPDNGYLALMEILFGTEFSVYTAVLIPHDDNRIADGVYMRERFFEEFEDEYDDYDVELLMSFECNLLEMLVALAFRIEDYFGRKDGIAWFWEMMTNIGLIYYNDREIGENPDSTAEINGILRKFLTRMYDKNGAGGLFPLKFPGRNQKSIEIWNQMNGYLNENYM